MNEKPTMAVVGLGFGRHIVEEQLLSGPGAEHVRLLGVCDMNQDLAADLASKNELHHYRSLDDILADPSIDSVGLFTGPVGRADLIRKIIRAGKHVMTTKPFELDPAAALAVLNEARSLGKAVHLNSPGPLCDAETAQISKWADEFDLGRPISFHWETHADYHNQADGSWYDDPEKCPVAPIFRLGIYAINQFVRLFGEVGQVRVVESRIRTGRPTSDNALLSLLFLNGVVGSIHVSFCVNNGYAYACDLTVNFERGTIRSEAVAADQHGMLSKRLWLQRPGKAGAEVAAETIIDRLNLPGGYQWEAFRQAVCGGGALSDEILPAQVASGIQVIHDMKEADGSHSASFG